MKKRLLFLFVFIYVLFSIFAGKPNGVDQNLPENSFIVFEGYSSGTWFGLYGVKDDNDKIVLVCEYAPYCYIFNKEDLLSVFNTYLKWLSIDKKNNVDSITKSLCELDIVTTYWEFGYKTEEKYKSEFIFEYPDGSLYFKGTSQLYGWSCIFEKNDANELIYYINKSSDMYDAIHKNWIKETQKEADEETERQRQYDLFD